MTDKLSIQIGLDDEETLDSSHSSSLSSLASHPLAEAQREGAIMDLAESSRKPSKARMSSSKLESDSSEIFHGQRPPQWEIASEKPEHRQIAYMIANGMSQAEVVRVTGLSQPAVSNLCRQPWFVKRVATIIEENGRSAIEETFKNAAMDSVHTIIWLRDNAKSETVKYNSAVHLLDRVLGKVGEPIMTEDGLKDPVAEEQRLKRELELLVGSQKTLKEMQDHVE